MKVSKRPVDELGLLVVDFWRKVSGIGGGGPVIVAPVFVGSWSCVSRVDFSACVHFLAASFQLGQLQAATLAAIG